MEDSQDKPYPPQNVFREAEGGSDVSAPPPPAFIAPGGSQGPSRRNQKSLAPRPCARPGCGRMFAPKRPHGEFCKDRCRAMAWQGRKA